MHPQPGTGHQALPPRPVTPPTARLQCCRLRAAPARPALRCAFLLYECRAARLTTQDEVDPAILLRSLGRRLRRRQVRSRRPHRAQWLGAHRSLARPNLSHDGLQYPRARTPERPQALTLASALPATRCRRRSRWRFSSLTCSHWRFPLDTRPLLTAPQDGGPAAARHGAAGGGCAEPAATSGRAAGPAAGAGPRRDAGLLARRGRHGGGGGQRRLAGHRRAQAARGLAGRLRSRGLGDRGWLG